VLFDALGKSRERIFLLRLDQDMEKLLKTPQQTTMEVQTISSYQRLIVHRAADHFRLDHRADGDGSAVILVKTNQSRIPAVRFLQIKVTETATAPSPEEPAVGINNSGSPAALQASLPPGMVRIMRRNDSKSPSPDSPGGSGNDGSGNRQTPKSVEERERDYAIARARIFADGGAGSPSGTIIPPVGASTSPPSADSPPPAYENMKQSGIPSPRLSEGVRNVPRSGSMGRNVPQQPVAQHFVPNPPAPAPSPPAMQIPVAMHVAPMPTMPTAMPPLMPTPHRLTPEKHHLGLGPGQPQMIGGPTIPMGFPPGNMPSMVYPPSQQLQQPIAMGPPEYGMSLEGPFAPTGYFLPPRLQRLSNNTPPRFMGVAPSQQPAPPPPPPPGPMAGKAILRDRNLEMKNPDFDRSYDRWAPRFTPNANFGEEQWLLQGGFMTPSNERTYATDFPPLSATGATPTSVRSNSARFQPAP